MNVSVAVHWRKPRGGRIRTVTWIVWMIRPETNGNAEAILKYSQYGDLEKTTVRLKVGQNRITCIYCLISKLFFTHCIFNISPMCDVCHCGLCCI